MNRDRHMAQAIQDTLLPLEPPQLERYCTRSLCVPGERVGGDLYDVVQLDGQHVMLYVADAAGHGISAAILALLFKHRLKLFDRTGTKLRPAAILGQMNEVLLNEISAPGVFVTAIFCLLDVETGKLTFSSAGHPPLLVHQANGRVKMFEHTGPALGLYGDAVFAEREILVRESDQVLLYTDGVFNRIDHRRLNQSQLVQELQSAEDRAFVLERILNTARSDQPSVVEDDMTLLLLVASPGVSRFDHRTNLADEDAPSNSDDPKTSRISEAVADGCTFLVLEGRITWEYSQGFFDVVIGSIERGLGIIVDLSKCVHMDSAVLGTLHELVERAEKSASGSNIRVQDASQSLIRTFAELGMDSVIRCVQMRSITVPETQSAVEVSPHDLRRQQMRLLKAHEALASLSDTNRDQFASVVSDLREHLTHLGGMTSQR
ncbi:MAG: SpoIIE family protein phosphatase [Pseudomonadales bacterium]|nr:SpoIIE family protein phosphatase [Pseudomonadales bacterium]